MKLSAANVMSIFLLSCMASGMASSATSLLPSSFEIATNQLKSKCVENLCLGSTIEEVMALGSIKWHKGREPTGLLKCNQAYDVASGFFTGTQGSKYSINFDLVKDAGTMLSRYRLALIGLRLGGASAQYANGEVANWTYRLKIPPSQIKNVSMMETPDKQFTIMVQWIGQESHDVMVMLDASYNHKEEWFQTFQKCRAKVNQ